MPNFSAKLPTTPDFARPITKRTRRRADSSLEGFFHEQAPLMPTLEQQGTSLSHDESKSDEELARLTQRLRRAKRRLLLQAVENNADQTERLREMLLQLSINSSSNSSGELSTCENFVESYT